MEVVSAVSERRICKSGCRQVKISWSEAKLWTCHSSSTDCEYVQWAISPESRALKLGEVLLGGNHRSQLNVTTDLQAVAPIVIAEPYYAVRQPSNDANYELRERGCIPTGCKSDRVILNAKL